MSTNLNCEGHPLWQTPTTITYMCMSYNEDGEPDGGMEGVRRRYLIWVRYSTNGAWNDPEEHEYALARVREHVAEIEAIPNPEFYAL